MAETSKIQWTEATWNPWHGCKKVSEGCKYCYMYRDKERYGQDPTNVMRSKANFKNPLKWKEPKIIFTCSWSDWFVEEADEWRDEAWKVIKDTPQHTYQILTKRPERILEHLPNDWGEGYPNVWLGVSVENSKTEHRIYELMNIPATIRFLSIEPMIGPVELYEDNMGSSLQFGHLIHWVIVGGESGNDTGKYLYRPCQLNWIDSIIKQSRGVGVPVFVKQLGTSLSKELGLKDKHGGDITEWSNILQIREMPKK